MCFWLLWLGFCVCLVKDYVGDVCRPPPLCVSPLGTYAHGGGGGRGVCQGVGWDTFDQIRFPGSPRFPRFPPELSEPEPVNLGRREAPQNPRTRTWSSLRGGTWEPGNLSLEIVGSPRDGVSCIA